MSEQVKVIIEVSGGVVKDVYAGDFVDVILVDWDNINDSCDEDGNQTDFAVHMEPTPEYIMPDDVKEMIRLMEKEEAEED